MQPAASSTHGCLNQTEAKALYNQADISTGHTCECIDLVSMGPFQTWSLNPDGTACTDVDACTATGVCGVGLCEPETPIDCSDGNLCTFDVCNPATGCVNPPQPEGTNCDDGDICNGFDWCQSGSCTNLLPPLVCDDALFCNGAEGCDSVSGCQAGTPPTIDDGVECTDDSCDEILDLVVHAPNAGMCDDFNSCTAESCDAVTGCANDPIPDCIPQVPALGRWGTAWLVGLIAVSVVARSRFNR